MKQIGVVYQAANGFIFTATPPPGDYTTVPASYIAVSAWGLSTEIESYIRRLDEKEKETMPDTAVSRPQVDDEVPF